MIKKFSIKPLMYILLIMFAERSFAADEYAQQLENIQIKAKRQTLSALPLTQGRKASDMLIDGEAFKMRSATLGNALAGEIGVHSNPFGGGASAPIIRGQEGVRVKVLQNGAEAIDMSQLSPDHASVVDTLLAKQVEIIRGTPTLLYATASPAGVVNVSDKRIPEKLPEKGYEGELSSRYNTNSREKLGSAGLTVGLGRHLAIRVEGLHRHSNNYRVPEFQLANKLNYVPDTFNHSKVGTLGASLVGSRGFLGAAYSIRRDKYGLPGHNHNFDLCIAHPIDNAFSRRTYLDVYPNLMDDSDLSTGPHFHCGTEIGAEHVHDHNHPYGHNHDHNHAGPWVDLVSKRWEIRGELNKPVAFLDKIRLNIAHSNYYHDEKDAGKDVNIYSQANFNPAKHYGRANNIFRNKGINARIELVQKSFKGWSGVIGAQFQKQNSSADEPYSREMKRPLVPNKDRRWSLFALEQLRVKNFLFELGARRETQRIHVSYDLDLLDRVIHPCKYRQNSFFECFDPHSETPDLSDYAQKAHSYSGSILWDIHPAYRLNFTASHNQRLPTPMELYYHGKHLATNSIELGNKNLRKEDSNNFELGLRHQSEHWDYRASIYYNRFHNYIYKEILYREGNLLLNRYVQSQARFHGFEFEVNYKPNRNWTLGIFGDYVRGRLVKLPDANQKVYDGTINPYTDEPNYEYLPRPQPDRNAPRVPPARLGIKIAHQFSENWRANLDYTRVFTQHKTALREYATEGYHLLNMGTAYSNKYKGLNYTISLNADNVLNQKVYIHTSFLPYVPQMGRNFSLGLKAEF